MLRMIFVSVLRTTRDHLSTLGAEAKELCQNVMISDNTVGFIKTVLSVYVLLMNSIYLSQSTQVAMGTIFWKHSVPRRMLV